MAGSGNVASGLSLSVLYFVFVNEWIGSGKWHLQVKCETQLNYCNIDICHSLKRETKCVTWKPNVKIFLIIPEHIPNSNWIHVHNMNKAKIPLDKIFSRSSIGYGWMSTLYEKWRNHLQHGRASRIPGSTIKWLALLTLGGKLVNERECKTTKMMAVKCRQFRF